MRAFLAIVGDTARLARSQTVFYVLAALLVLMSLGFVIVVKPVENEKGEKYLSFIFGEPKDRHLETTWYGGYAESTQINIDQEDLNDSEKRMARIEKMMEEASGLSRYERSVQGWHYTAQIVLFTVTMWLFLAACAGYFPGLMKEGAVDVVLAKPVPRWLVFLGRFVGGLILLAIVLLVAQTILFVGLALKTGIWHTGAYASFPLLIFVAALLYAIIALLGIAFNSSNLALFGGYFLYLGVDTVMSILIGLRKEGTFDEFETFGKIIDGMQASVPNFGMLKSLACVSVLSVPAFPWQPFMVASAWLVGALGLAFFLFRRRDF
ncbi:MAG TPA: ABC transporter permease [Planctomycetes bacterium]|nr:ABC transporter permease [Planctomycetota bacterium]